MVLFVLLLSNFGAVRAADPVKTLKLQPMVVTGGQHSLALKADGTVWAWGRNDYGQLGLGASFTAATSSTPRQITFFSDNNLKVVSVAAGQFHSMALTDDGDVYVWGRNDRGQIGYGLQASTGTYSMFTIPRLVTVYRIWNGSAYANVAQPKIAFIAAGNNHCIALTTQIDTRLFPGVAPAGRGKWQYAFGWGENGNGQLGTNDLVDKAVPSCYNFEIYRDEGFYWNDFTGVEAGANHTLLALRTWSAGTSPLTYRQFAAGDNTYGQLHGIYFDNPQKTFYRGVDWAGYPIRVHAGNNYSFVSAERWSGDQVLASDPTAAGEPLYGSGINKQGQIGIGYTGGDATTGATSGWPGNLYDGSYGLYGLRQLACGASHNLARTADGHLYVWGANKSSDGATVLYQLGLNGQTDGDKNHNLPRLHPHANVQDVALVAAGGNSSFAVRRDGTVYGWGANQYSQLGLGGAATTAKGVPTALSGNFRLWTDIDNDGLPDEWELYYFRDLAQEPSGHGPEETLTYMEKWERHLNPTSVDTDGDGLSDDYEVSNHVFMPDLADPSSADYDNDGLTNLQENDLRTSSESSDTDGDGTSDLQEVQRGSDPLWKGDFGVPPPPTLEQKNTQYGGSSSWNNNSTPTPTTADVVVDVTVGDSSGSASEIYKIVIRRSDGTTLAEVFSPDYGELGNDRILLPAGDIYSFEIVHIGTDPIFYEENGFSNYDWKAQVNIVSGASSTVYDPENILREEIGWPNDTFLAAGKRAYVGGVGQPADCDQPTFLTSTSEASGPSYRKIALNGLPMPDSKPQAKDETDQEREQTYVDALTQQLRHSTTDVYVPLVGNELTLSVRRDVVPEIWGTHPGLPPETAVNRPFGLGWTTNLCSHIQFIYHIKNTPTSDCATERPQPDIAVVTDESGQSHRFLRIWRKDASNNALEEAFLPYPSNRNEGESFLTELSWSAAEQRYIFRKKFGTTIRYEKSTLFQWHNTSRKTPSDRIEYTYARAVEAVDRLGNKLVYTYDPTDVSLVPKTITANGNRSIIIQKDPGATGVIRSVTDPRSLTTNYGYTAKTYSDPYRGRIQYQVLTSVTTPELTATKYAYEAIGPIWDYTPYAEGNKPEYQEYFFASHLNQIVDANGNATTLVLAEDQSRYSYSTAINDYYLVPGQPRIVTQVFFPQLTGETSSATSIFASQSVIRVGYSGNSSQPQLYGQRKLNVQDTTGQWRTWNFGKPNIIIQDEFENLLYATDDLRSTPFLILYTELQITHPTTVTETFSFDPSAGMALKSVKDYSGNLTQYLHDEVWNVPVSLSWVPAGYLPSRYADPTAQINPRLKEKGFKYSAERVLKEVTDEEGRRTEYDVQLGTGLRLSERIYSAAPENRLMQETEWQYSDPKFSAFVTRKIVHRHTSDPSWAISRVTEYTPDDYGYVKYEKVSEGTKWLLTEYEHDKNGNQTKVYDPRRNLTEFAYDKNNRLRTVTYPTTAGLTAPVTKQFGYDARGNKTSEKDERGNCSLWVYDEWSRVKQQVRDMNGNALVDPTIDLVTTFTYNPANSRLTVKDPRGNTTTTWYDSLQRPYRIQDAKTNVTQLFYDGPNAGASAFDVSGFKPTRTIDSRGYTIEVEYDTLYRPILKRAQVTKAPLPVTYAVTQTDYDEVGNPVKVWDPLNPKGATNSHAIVTDYDALNRPVKVTYQNGTYTEERWTTTGLKWQAENENRVVAETMYDGAGRAVTVTSGINAAGVPLVRDENGILTKVITKTEYDDAGNISVVTNPRNEQWSYFYDARNRKTDEYAPAIFDVETQTSIRPHTQWVYDGVGNTIKTITPKGSRDGADPAIGTTDMRYDKANRLYETEGPAVLTLSGAMERPLTKTFYDKNGNVEDVDDANRNVTHNVYDELNRLASTRDAELNTVSYGYDAVGNRTTITDPKGSTTFEYDGLNRPTKTTDAATKVTRFEYDGLNKTARVDAQSRRTEYRYDLRHRLEKVWYYAPDGTPVDDAVNAWRTHGYDDAGNLRSIVEPAKGGAADVGYTYDALNRVETETSRGVTHVYRYDVAGNRRFITYGGTNREVEYLYDGGNRLTEIKESGRSTTYGYDLNGNIARKTLPNSDVVVQGYDALNRLQSSEAKNSGGTLLQKYEQVFDVAGNLRKVIETYGDASLNRTRELLLDKVNRLKEEKVTPAVGSVETTVYGYDGAYNRTSKIVTGGSNPGTTTYTPNNLNQVKAVSGPGINVTLDYDEDGNRKTLTGTIARGAAGYGYDYENRLVSVTQGGVTYGYTYDYRSRRVTRIEGGVSTASIFSGGLSYMEQQGGATTAEFLRGQDMGGGVGGLLYSIRSGSLRYSHTNSRGDVVAQTDQTGALSYQSIYEAFGQRTLENGFSADRQKANTKEEDPTGLLNEGFRYRDLELGCFINRDPAGFVDGPNLYAYVCQNPWSKFDPEGLQAAPPIAPPPVTPGEVKAAMDMLNAGTRVGVGGAMTALTLPFLIPGDTRQGVTDSSGGKSLVAGVIEYGKEIVKEFRNPSQPRSMNKEQQDQVKEAWSTYLVERQTLGEQVARNRMNAKLDDATSTRSQPGGKTARNTSEETRRMVDPGQLRLPPERSDGADKQKLADQIAKYGGSTETMSPIEVTEGADGEMMINNGVTRATRAYLSGKQVPVQIIERQPSTDFTKLPSVKEKTK